MTHAPNDSCEELEPGLAAIALGEAAPDDAVRAHLATCPRCRHTVRAYAQVARVLPYEAPEAAPPADLRRRIVAAVAAAEQRARPKPAPRPSRRWLRLPAVGAALALLVALLVWNVRLQQRLDSATAQVAQYRAGWQQMIVLLNAEDVRWYAVSGGGASGRLWAVPQQRAACLVVQGMPQLAAGTVYQVWFVRGTERVSGGVFEARNGNGWVLVEAAEPPGSYDAIAISVEPRGGSAAPSGPDIVRGDLVAGRLPSLAERRLALDVVNNPLGGHK